MIIDDINSALQSLAGEFFDGAYTPGLQGSNGNIADNAEELNQALFGDGGSMDQGGGGGGYSGGGPVPIPTPDSGGGPGGSGASNYVGGQSVMNTCRNTVIVTWSDFDDDDEPPHYTIEVIDSGPGASNQGLNQVPMTLNQVNPCRGGGSFDSRTWRGCIPCYLKHLFFG